MSVDQAERMARSVDVLQIGARNSAELRSRLQCCGPHGQADPLASAASPRRSMSELLAAAEYILSERKPACVL